MEASICMALDQTKNPLIVLFLQNKSGQSRVAIPLGQMYISFSFSTT
jgi:hypothetical protein